MSDPRLGRAIVAIHDQSGHKWNNESLAAIAGLSPSRFLEVFLATVGEPPVAYLQWIDQIW
ncbi:MAG: helix-turn-helix transcriptional regulator [Hyphomicrobiales bacterium]|nr:helix-turn-helix transcriptional regulator [Hyphomicrobiales bacterium]